MGKSCRKLMERRLFIILWPVQKRFHEKTERLKISKISMICDKIDIKERVAICYNRLYISLQKDCWNEN